MDTQPTGYLERIESCETNKDLLQVLDQLNVESTPAEIIELKRIGVSRPLATEWLENASHFITCERQTVSTFRRERISPWMDLYVSPEGERKKSLLIGFTGRNHKISCPIYSLLQTAPEQTYDVLILRDPLKVNYLGGIQGFGNSLIALLDYVRERFLDQYTDTRVIGSSGGGFAALVAGRYLQSRRTLAACGFLMSTGFMSKRSKKKVAERSKLEAQILDQINYYSSVRSICLIPSRSEIEKLRGGMLAAAFDSKLITVEGASDHGILYELLKDAKLRDVLQKLLFSDDRNYDADQDIANGAIKPAWSGNFYESRISELETEIKTLKESALYRVTVPLRKIYRLKVFSRLTATKRSTWLRGRRTAANPPTSSLQPGKISRGRLQLSGPPVLSGTALERRIARIFAEQLNVDVVGMTDDFFDLGGDSLAAEAMVISINQTVEYQFQVSDLFENSTPRKIAKLVKQSEAVG